ncbi:MAG: FtsX-like permease family protein [Pseudomonadota bacterium]
MSGVIRISAELAWRNLWRNRRRTLIMLGAVGVGAWAMIFMTALTQGMVTEMVRDGLSVLPGHAQIHHPDYRDDPNIANLISVADSELERRLASGGFEEWSTRIRVPAVVSSERETRGVTLLGIDPARERNFTFVDLEAIEGRFLDDADDPGIVIGRKLADKLETRLGKRVVVMSQDPDNELADRGFRVVGVYRANLPSYEEIFVLTGKRTAQGFLKVEDRVTEAIVMGDDFRDVAPVLAELSTLMQGDPVAVNGWRELDTYLGAFLPVMDGFVLVWVVVIFLALSFGLVNTLIMSIFERVREIGVMLALGMRPAAVLWQIIIESMLLLAIGLAIGNLLALASVHAMRDGIDLSVVAEGMEMMGASSRLTPDLRLYDVVLANVVVLVLGFLASLSPAWRASRYDPIEAITKIE